jgi:hypothetical protein
MFNLNPADADKRGGGIYLWIRVEDGDIDASTRICGPRGWFSVRDLNGYVLAFNKANPRP